MEQLQNVMEFTADSNMGQVEVMLPTSLVWKYRAYNRSATIKGFEFDHAVKKIAPVELAILENRFALLTDGNLRVKMALDIDIPYVATRVTFYSSSQFAKSFPDQHLDMIIGNPICYMLQRSLKIPF